MSAVTHLFLSRVFSVTHLASLGVPLDVFVLKSGRDMKGGEPLLQSTVENCNDVYSKKILEDQEPQAHGFMAG